MRLVFTQGSIEEALNQAKVIVLRELDSEATREVLARLVREVEGQRRQIAALRGLLEERDAELAGLREREQVEAT